MQIENVITAHPQIREAAAVSVPDEKFGEVVGIWIVRESADDANDKLIGPLEVRSWIKDKMNPQVKQHFDLLATCHFLNLSLRMPLNMCGSSDRKNCSSVVMKIYPRPEVAKSRKISCESGVENLRRTVSGP